MITQLHLLATFLALANVSTPPFVVEKSSLTIDGVEQEFKIGSVEKQPVRRSETINAGLGIKLAKNVKNPCPDSMAHCSVIVKILVLAEGKSSILAYWEYKPASFEPGYTFSYETGPVNISESVPLGDAEICFKFLKNEKEFAQFIILLEIKESLIVVGD